MRDSSSPAAPQNDSPGRFFRSLFRPPFGEVIVRVLLIDHGLKVARHQLGQGLLRLIFQFEAIHRKQDTTGVAGSLLAADIPVRPGQGRPGATGRNSARHCATCGPPQSKLRASSRRARHSARDFFPLPRIFLPAQKEGGIKTCLSAWWSYTERNEGPVPGLDEELIRQNGGTIRYGKAVG